MSKISITHVNALKYKKIFFTYIIVILLIQIPILSLKLPVESEGWHSDIAYNLNWELNGKMAKDIPWGAIWSTGIGKLYFFIHYLIYKILGIGLLQARLITFVSSVFLLFGVFKWTHKNISTDIALLSTILLTVSFSFCPFLPLARNDVIHCVFAFFSFYLISSAISTQRDIYFFVAGLFSALSVDISYRGIEIVMAVYLFYFVFYYKKILIRHLLLLLVGSFITFIIWFLFNVLPMGLSNFFQYNVRYIETGQAIGRSIFDNEKLLSEVYRFIGYLKSQRNFALIEICYWIIFLFIFYKSNLRLRYNKSVKLILWWLMICFVVMSLIEERYYPSYILMYSPFICILCGIGLQELYDKKNSLAYSMLFLIMFMGIGYQIGRSSIYSYNLYAKNNLGMQGYFERLRSSIDLSKNIIGAPEYWYAFSDAKQYYGGGFYMGRVITVLKEFKPENEYKNNYEKVEAILNVFKKRKIEYIIADDSFKNMIAKYFPNKELPLKNFKLIDTIKNNFERCNSNPLDPHCKIEKYQIISYEP